MITTTYNGKYYDVEYSIINVSELEGELRIDAEYYEPYYLKTFNLFRDTKTVRELKKDIRYGLYVEPVYVSKGINFVRALNLLNFWIEGEIIKIPPDKVPQIYTLKTDDIIIVRSGANTGSVCIVDPAFDNSTFGSYIIKVSLKKNLINPKYVAVFLNSKYGLLQSIRLKTGSSQLNLNIPNIESLKIPIPSETFQKLIEKLVLKAYEEKEKSEKFYKQAEEILLEELGLKNWKPKTKKIKIGGREFEEEENVSIRMLSDVLKADRMDAEYWELKYDEIEKLIKNYKNGYSRISKEFLHKTMRLKINNDKYYNYIEISSVNVSNGDFAPSFLKGEDLPANAKLKIDKNDLIVSKVRTYRKGIALINKSYPDLIGSSAFTILHEKENNRVNIETLFIFLRTDILSLWSYKFYTGTSYPTLTDEDILNLPMPLIDNKTQQKISSLVQQSHEARENSKKLLEIAKRAVEIYIEKDETEGQKYINEQLQKMRSET